MLACRSSTVTGATPGFPAGGGLLCSCTPESAQFHFPNDGLDGQRKQQRLMPVNKLKGFSPGSA